MIIFSSKEKLEEYFKCLLNLKPGDKIWFYTEDQLDQIPSSIYSDKPQQETKEAEVIGIVEIPNYSYSYLFDHKNYEMKKTIVIGGDYPYFDSYDTWADDFIKIITPEMLRGHKRIFTLADDILVAKVVKARTLYDPLWFF